jgi:iron complex outermembrane receptor protein
MNAFRAIALGGASLLSLSVPAYAQDTVTAAPAAGSEDAGGEIIVTARRRDESLQNVPQTVSAVTSDVIEKLNIQNLKDIQNVVPGLQLAGGNTGSDSGFTLRGVSFTTLDGVPVPTIAFYVNEVPTDANQVFQSMFDVGQVEVLRGPQGTARGRSAPSGAITITTRQPDLDQVGGYIDMTGTERSNINVNGGVNVPILPGVLAVRVSGIVDHDDLNGVKSVNSGLDPFKKTEALRGTVRFQPADGLDATVMYQKLWSRNRSFPQVFGSGSPGVPALGLPARYNGPVITPEDRLSVSEQPLSSNQQYDLLTANANWRFAGQKLSYVFGYSKVGFNTLYPQDQFNAFPNASFGGFDTFQDITTAASTKSHELRLASDERLFGFLDYTLGGYYSKLDAVTNGLVGPQNPYFVTQTSIDSVVASTEHGLFGNVTVHLGDRTEISGGARHIWFKSVNDPAAKICTAIPAFNLNLCQPNAADVDDQQWVYSGSISHKLNDDLLLFANIGTSYRPPFSVIFTNPLSGFGLQSATDLTNKTEGETSRGIELGFKSTFMDRRGRLNVTLFHQKFNNTSVRTGLVNYLNMTNPIAPSVSQDRFTSTNDAVVKGVDIEAGFRFSPRFNASLGFSYAKSNVSNQPVPCNDSNFDGVPDTGAVTAAAFRNAGVFIARCNSNQSISRAPNYSITAQAEYIQPISGAVDGFLRGNIAYYPDNPNQSREANVVIGKYVMLDMFTGIRSPEGDWEVSLFAKNILNTQQIIEQDLAAAPITAGGNTFNLGYTRIGYTQPREVGLNVRYRFGSR